MSREEPGLRLCELTGKRGVEQARGKETLDKQKNVWAAGNGQWKMADETPTGGMFAGMESGFVSVTALACALEEMEADAKCKEEEEEDGDGCFGVRIVKRPGERATTINTQLSNSEEAQRVELVAVSWFAVQGRDEEREKKRNNGGSGGRGGSGHGALN